MILFASFLQYKCRIDDVSVCVCEYFISVLFLNSTRESSVESQSPLSMRRAVSCTGKMCESWLLVSILFCMLLCKEKKLLMVISLCIRFCHLYEYWL